MRIPDSVLPVDKEVLRRLNSELARESPEAILSWAWETFSLDLALSSSFQTQSVPLLHMVSRVTPQLTIFFLDTGFHFPETLGFRDRLTREWRLKVRNLRPAIGHEGFLLKYGQLYRSDPDMCCYINKVEPLRRAIKGLRGWVSGLRRDQTPQRRDTPIVSVQSDGLYRIAPLASWTWRDVRKYLRERGLPEHPLFSKGYLSIGCQPCTRPVVAGQEERSGRWADRNKTECGIHLPINPLETHGTK